MRPGLLVGPGVVERAAAPAPPPPCRAGTAGCSRAPRASPAGGPRLAEMSAVRRRREPGEPRLDEVPVGLVVGGRRHAAAPVVRRPGEVDAVEPVAGVVAVAVHLLGPQQVLAGVDERHALGEHGEVHPQVLRPHAVGRRRRQRVVVLADVPQRLVVVGGDVDDVLLRVVVVARRRAVVVDVGALDGVAVAVDELVVGEVAGEADADLVGRQQQLVELGLASAARPARWGRTTGR